MLMENCKTFMFIYNNLIDGCYAVWFDVTMGHLCPLNTSYNSFQYVILLKINASQGVGEISQWRHEQKKRLQNKH